MTWLVVTKILKFQVPDSFCYNLSACSTAGIIACVGFKVNRLKICWNIMVCDCCRCYLYSLATGEFVLDEGGSFFVCVCQKLSLMFLPCLYLFQKFIMIRFIFNFIFIQLMLRRYGDALTCLNFFEFVLIYLQYHTMRNVLFMAMTEFKEVQIFTLSRLMLLMIRCSVLMLLFLSTLYHCVPAYFLVR